MPLKMRYFVLNPWPRHRPESDPHACASRGALLTYATYIERSDSFMAEQLREWANKRPREPEEQA